jgi:hypothetical protein
VNAHNIPVIHCAPGARKHEVAQKYLPHDPVPQGLFLILAAKAPALVWEVSKGKTGAPRLARRQPWPYVNH